MLKLPGFCAISCQMTPLFWICHLMSQMIRPLFARKLSLMVPQFDASVWAPLSLLYVSAPPRGGTVFPNNMEVSSLVINITTKGHDLKSSLRVSSQISSKHTYLLVPSGNLPLNNRANFYFEVKIPDWCYNLYPQFNCKIAPKRLQLFPLLKYMFYPLLSNNYVIYI